MRSDAEILLESLDRQKLDYTFYELADMHALRLEHQPPGFDPGEIEQLVYKRHQRFGRGADRLDIGLLLLRQGRKGKQPGHPDHPTHGRTDLMTDRGQQPRLCKARLLGALPGVNERRFALLALGDVPRDGEMARPALVIVQVDFGPDNPPQALSRMDYPFSPAAFTAPAGRGWNIDTKFRQCLADKLFGFTF